MKNLEFKFSSQEIQDFCHRWKIVELSLFGSVLRSDYRHDSDVDLLVTFSSDSRWSLFDMVRMQEDIERILRRDVDLVSREGIEASQNYIRRKAILESAEVIYAA
ncbi:MAG: nucleotidyltransferase domain-containing protein [Chloroflexota bacterium]|nr:nucleotidyltransferase domain-containing protein [Chloroflexota bacterium]